VERPGLVQRSRHVGSVTASRLTASARARI
jgi:hypothetical protein